MNTEQERAAFEAWLRVKPCGAAHDFGWAAWQARAALQSQDREDAERYRWLRARWGRIADEYDGDSDQLVAIREADSHFEGWDVDPASLDRAIDAALAQRQGEGS